MGDCWVEGDGWDDGRVRVVVEWGVFKVEEEVEFLKFDVVSFLVWKNNE